MPIIIITFLMGSPITSVASHPHDKLKGSFMHERMNKAFINPTYLLTGKRYIGCNLLEAKPSLKSLINSHQNICNTKFQISKSYLFADEDSDSILLKGTHHIQKGKLLCHSINSNLVVIKTFEKARKLNAFVGKNKAINLGFQSNK